MVIAEDALHRWKKDESPGLHDFQNTRCTLPTKDSEVSPFDNIMNCRFGEASAAFLCGE